MNTVKTIRKVRKAKANCATNVDVKNKDRMRQGHAQHKTNNAGSVSVWAISKEHADRTSTMLKIPMLSLDFTIEMTVKTFLGAVDIKERNIHNK